MCLEYTLKKHEDHKKCSGKRSRICSVYIDTKVTNNTKSFPDHYNAKFQMSEYPQLQKVPQIQGVSVILFQIILVFLAH